PVDAILVLGGSIYREIYAAEIAKQYPKIPILISQGSPEPCIWLIFNHAEAPKAQVLLEKCAKSTFDNFYFSIPIFQKWQVHKIKVITSSSHLPRAKWLAQIMLGSKRIWVEMELVKGTGTPGNHESWLKTGLDLTRATVWAVTSNFLMKPQQCNATITLSSVDMQFWHTQGFTCEYKSYLVKELIVIY
ncbi:MAG: YdcF family protein, partial [Nostocales cyanobacterium W4_Combined_metabat2_030]|nr:YdcF family protein [Nostocales cyanobacterium W4_Combined_metabat2_030]